MKANPIDLRFRIHWWGTCPISIVISFVWLWGSLLQFWMCLYNFQDCNNNSYQTHSNTTFCPGDWFHINLHPLFSMYFCIFRTQTLGELSMENCWCKLPAFHRSNRGQIYDESPEAAKKEAKTFVDKMCPRTPPPKQKSGQIIATSHDLTPKGS